MARALSVARYLALFSLCAAPLAGQQRFTLEHYRRTVGVGGVALAPDGRTVVVTVTRRNYDGNRNESELYAVDVASGATRQLTTDRRSVAEARFSPDGSTLAFLAKDTASRMQIWLMPMRGGEARRLTSHPTSIEHYSWRPDGKAIAYAAADEAPKRDGEAKHLASVTIGAQDMFLRETIQPQHIWLIDTDSAVWLKRHLGSGGMVP